MKTKKWLPSLQGWSWIITIASDDGGEYMETVRDVRVCMYVYADNNRAVRQGENALREGLPDDIAKYDFNRDKKITTKDALLILKASVV